jgi:hypothetical protein
MSFIVTKKREEVFKEFELESTFYMWNYYDEYVIKEKLIYADEDKENIVYHTIEDVENEIFESYQKNIKDIIKKQEKNTSGFWFSVFLFFKDSKAIIKHNKKMRNKQLLEASKTDKFQLIFKNKIEKKQALPEECNFVGILNNSTSIYIVNTNDKLKKTFLEMEKYEVENKFISFNLEENEHTNFDIQYEVYNKTNNKKTTIKVKSDLEGERVLSHNNEHFEVFLSETEAEDFCKNKHKEHIQKKTK